MAMKLHELIAVEGDLDAVAKKIAEETVVTFTKKADLLLEITTELTMLDDKDAAQNTAEHKPMVTTVAEKLDWTATTISKHWDVVLQKECTNQVAKGDLVVDGKVLAMGLPATFLLGMEGKLKALREIYLAIPTLDPGKEWQIDPTSKNAYRMAHPVKRIRTAKAVRHKVLYEATKEHPAQIEKWNEDVAVATITEHRRSGMMTSAQKSDCLERLDTLLRAVRQARQRANGTEVVKGKIGGRLFAYINAGELLA